MLQCAVGPLLDAQFVCVDPVPEELGIAGRSGAHHQIGVEILRYARGTSLVGRLELHDAPEHVGDLFAVDRPGDLLVDEEALAQCGLFGTDDVGEFSADAHLFAGTQVAVVGLLAVGGHDADITGVVEHPDDLAQRVIVGPGATQAHHGPHLDHRRRSDDSGVAGSLGGGLIDIDRVLVPECVQPMLDHRLVHRVTSLAGLALSGCLDLLGGLLNLLNTQRRTPVFAQALIEEPSAH